MLVVPLLVENWQAYRPMLDRVAVVDCDETQQLSRTAARAGLNLEQAHAILSAQASRAARLQIADDLIDNHGDLANLVHQVECLHLKYLKLAAELSRQV
jgi:dephospho-CoA kinase